MQSENLLKEGWINIDKKGAEENCNTKARILFYRQEKESLLFENPNIKFGDLGRLLLRRWRNLDNSEKEKYETLADMDLEVYSKSLSLKIKDLESQLPQDILRKIEDTKRELQFISKLIN